MKNKSRVSAAVVLSLLLGGAAAGDIKVHLSGDSEVPPVKTAATGDGVISVGDDGAVSGSVTTHGIDGTMGHIHLAAPGQNGPVIVKLVKDGDKYSVPAGAKLDADQLKAFHRGELYINVHSEAHKSGEIRGALK
jgi:hypothetical protein